MNAKKSEPENPSGNTDQEEQDRGQWGGKLDFLLSSLSQAVGLGNVWRFPFMCFKNGGAVFLIPYVLMLVLVGFPAYFMELCLGQFSGKGPVDLWAAVPVMRGIGYTMLMNSFVQAIYYIVLVAWTLYYTFSSFTSELPWSTCRHGFSTWATKRCYSTADESYCQGLNQNLTYYEGSCLDFDNISDHHSFGNLTTTFPSEEYFDNVVLHRSKNNFIMDYMSWKLALSLLGAWVIIFFCMIRGSKSFGKVAYVTATFPYIVLTVLLVKGATLPGAENGVSFYIIPKFEKLTEPSVWFDAASQIFFSLGPGLGSVATYGSFNEFKKNNKRDAYVVAFGNSLTSLYAGFAIFCILGFMAHDAGLSLEDIAVDGSGLAFIAYPQAVSRMAVAPLWSVLFFIMLLTLGAGTMFGLVEMVMTIIQDTWPFLRKYKIFLLAGLLSFMYLIGLPMTTNIGVYILTICNDYNAYCLVLVSIFEIMTIAYVYGVKRFISDIELMLDTKLSIYWRITWTFTAPLLTLGVVIFSFVMHKTSVYENKPLPDWFDNLGWGIVAITLFPIPTVMAREIFNNKNKSLGWKALITPTDEWYPAGKEYRQAYLDKYSTSKEAENGQIEMVAHHTIEQYKF